MLSVHDGFSSAPLPLKTLPQSTNTSHLMFSEKNSLNPSPQDGEKQQIFTSSTYDDPLNTTNSGFLLPNNVSAIAQLSKANQLEENSLNSSQIDSKQQEIAEFLGQLDKNGDGSGAETDGGDVYGNFNMSLLEINGLVLAEESGSGSGDDSSGESDTFSTFISSAFSLSTNETPGKSIVPERTISAARDEGGISRKRCKEKKNEISIEENEGKAKDEREIKVEGGSGAEDGSGSGEQAAVIGNVNLEQVGGDQEPFKARPKNKRTSQRNGKLQLTIYSETAPTPDQARFMTSDENPYVGGHEEDREGGSGYVSEDAFSNTAGSLHAARSSVSELGFTDNPKGKQEQTEGKRDTMFELFTFWRNVFEGLVS
ncbi:uncharacterized protein LOC119781456 [Cyprinodon tularosa]|uniref:uncharacterized protein LOC119781456 n=1 Tax=Cyprinodon tularosa TaxID=77115 RepID=UPI0018E23A40|nr:uncharacterized protein LOC119781456 [Cyprinodon tularosa]